jgi:hemerythrin
MAESPTGIETMDVHHRVQGGLVDLLEQLLARGADRALADETLTRLVDFTQAHFRTEEHLMGKHGYPGRASHAEAHARLSETVLAIQRAHAGGVVRGPETAAALRAWFQDHVQDMDAAFAAWCQANGVQAE